MGLHAALTDICILHCGAEDMYEHKQSMNHISLKKSIEVTGYTKSHTAEGHVSANTRVHQLRGGDQEMGMDSCLIHSDTATNRDQHTSPS